MLSARSMASAYNWFVDLETSGLDLLGCDILTGAIVIDDRDRNTVETFTFKAKPNCKKYFSEEAQRVHGISYEVATGFPHINHALNDIIALLDKYPMNKFICHALSYSFWSDRDKMKSWAYIDHSALQCAFLKHKPEYDFYKNFTRDKRISTIDLAKEVGHDKRRLNKLCEFYGIELQHHEALSDTMACRELYYILRDKIWESNKNNTTNTTTNPRTGTSRRKAGGNPNQISLL